MILILILYLIIAYFTMFIFSTFMVGTTHKPDLSTKAIGVAIFLLAPVTFILLIGWFLFCIIYNLFV